MTEKPSIDWKTYENITKYIYEKLGVEFGIKIEGYGNKFKIQGKSGVKHQIDVLTSQSDSTTTAKTAIECKYWNKKVSKDAVMKLSSIIQDSDIDKGIIVSKSGFTKDAYNFAKHYNIDIVELREFDKNRKESVSKQLEIASILIKADCTLHRPEILKIIAHPGEQEIELADMYKIRVVIAPWLRFPLSKYLSRFQEELHAQYKISKTITKRYDDINAFLEHANNDYPIKITALSFTGVLKKINSQHNTDILLTENVSLIMKSIFDERTFSISENGIIVENKSNQLKY